MTDQVTDSSTTHLSEQSQSDSVFSQPSSSGPFIIETVAISISMIGIIGAVIALAHLAQQV